MKSPKLRFPKFTDEWSNVQLGELLEFNNGINAGKDSYGKGRKFINVLDILNNEHIIYENIKGSVEVDAKTEKNNKVEYGDLVFLRSSETREDVGKCSVYLDEEEYCLFGGFVIRGKKIAEYDPYFLKLNLETPLIRHQIGSKSGGSTRFNVSQGILNSIDIRMPSIGEQKAISKFMDMFNKKIQLQQQKIDLLQEQKKGFLQKMFPKAGETQPEMRFDGFTGDWEERKLNEFTTYGSSSYSLSQFLKDDFQGVYPVFDANNEIARINTYAQENDYISIIKDGAGIGRTELRPAKSSVIGTMGYINPNNSDINFIYALMKNINWSKYQNGSTIPHVYYRDYGNEYFNIPRYEEQQQIGLFFKKLDDTIGLHQRKLDICKEQKKGFMQQMFI